MKIRITKKGLPKAQMWNSQIGKATLDQEGLVWGTNPGVVTKQEMDASFGECGPGMVFSEVQQTCVSQQEADSEKQALQGFGNFMNRKKKGLPTNPFKSTGNEGTVSNPMGASVLYTPQGNQMLYNNQYYDQAGANAIGANMMKGLKPFGSRKEVKGFVGDYNNAFGTDYKVPFMTADRVKLAKNVGGVGDALLAASSAVDYYDQTKKAKEWERFNRQRMFDLKPTGEFEGNYTVNTGTFQPNKLPIPNEGMFEYGGLAPFNDYPMPTIRITSTPDMREMAYGGQSGYGLDTGQRKLFTDMPDSMQDSVSSTIGAVPREMANIEAEGGETVYGDLDGDGGLEHMKISGPRHTNGGVPLNIPEGSFIFSDTKKMTIKDPNILSMFGMTKPSTPAKIAKRYDVNKYKAIMENPDADIYDKGTAQLMVKNYQKMLGNLSMIQEDMKGMPQGVPDVAQAAMGVSQMAYGGFTLPQYQTKGQVKLGDWTDDYDKLQSLLMDPKNAELRKEMFSRYKSGRGAKDDITEDQYVKNLMEAQRQIYALQNAYGNDPEKLNQLGWDKGGINKRYSTEAKKLGLGTLSEQDIKRFQNAYMDMADLVEDKRFTDNFGQYFQINPQGRPDQKYKNRAISPDDGWWGNTTNRQYLQLRAAKPVVTTPTTYYKCAERSESGAPSFESKPFNTPEEAAAAGFSASQSEAAKLCGIDEIPPGKIPPGKTPIPPFKMLFPDKLNMLASAAIPPKALFPYSPDLNMRQGQYALPDWLAKAQQLQQGYNVAADTMGTYGPASGLAANLSFLSGQTGNAVTTAQDQTGQQAIGIFNEFSNRELARQDKTDLYNTMNAKDRFDNAVRTRQAFDNARRLYINNMAKGYSNAWNNRMKMGLLNVTNPIYNISPDTGQSFFMSGYGPESFGMAKNAGQTMSSDNLRKFTQAKNKYKAADMSDRLAEEYASKEVFGAAPSSAAAGQFFDAGMNFNPSNPTNI
jgi:hypothetical protein